MSSSSDWRRAPRRFVRRLVDGTRERYRRPSALRRAAARTELIARALPHRGRARTDEQRVRAGSAAPAAQEMRTVTRIDPSLGTAAAAQIAAASDADLLCFVRPSSEPVDPDWLARLARRVTGDVAAATAQLVHPRRAFAHATPYDGCVRELGLDLTARDGVPIVLARGAGDPVDGGGEPLVVDAASSACLVVERAAFVACGGLSAADDIDVAVLELCLRLRAIDRTVVVVPEVVVFDHRPVASMRALREPLDPAGPAWRALIERAGSSVMRIAAPMPAGGLRIALTVAAPSEKMAPRWGDWHLAQSLAHALRRQGHAVRVQTADHADDLAGRACDVHCVMHGLAAVARTPGQVHVVWIISHPETVDGAECDAADLVLVASHRYADELRARTTTPVEVMLQATDTRRFWPHTRDARFAHEIVVVAKSREIPRPIVMDAVGAGLRPAIYGSGWEQFVDPGLVVSDYVRNDDLPLVYSSAGVLLNDHWDEMRRWGFVSNRIFDALACGTPIVSDDLPEIADLFGDAVRTYRTSSDLRAIVDEILADPAAARARLAAASALVRTHHSMDHRAQELIDALARHALTD